MNFPNLPIVVPATRICQTLRAWVDTLKAPEYVVLIGRIPAYVLNLAR